MKKLFYTIASALLILFLPFSILTGQDKSSEKNIKIIIKDDSGTKVVIDTLIKGGSPEDPIKLKDGTVIFIEGNNHLHGATDNGVPKQVYVTVKSDGKESGKIVKEVTVISTDSVKSKESEGSDKIYVYSTSDPHSQNSMTWSDKDGKVTGERVIIINDENLSHSESGDVVIHSYKHENVEQNKEVTKYVIKKDGMVISIEGDDYAKVKELVNLLEDKLELSKENSDKKETAPEEPKKAGKKK
jgi:hypothetical protein